MTNLREDSLLSDNFDSFSAKVEKRDSHKPLKDNKKDRIDAVYPKRDQDEESVLSWASAYGKNGKIS